MRLTSRNLALLATAVFAVAFFALPTPAFANLSKATGTIQKIKDWIWIIIPVICLILGGIIGVAYSADVIRKETAYNWIVGVVFAGAIAGGIVELVF